MQELGEPSKWLRTVHPVGTRIDVTLHAHGTRIGRGRCKRPRTRLKPGPPIPFVVSRRVKDRLTSFASSAGAGGFEEFFLLLVMDTTLFYVSRSVSVSALRVLCCCTCIGGGDAARQLLDDELFAAGWRLTTKQLELPIPASQ
jgi:hypothetical protein